MHSVRGSLRGRKSRRLNETSRAACSVIESLENRLLLATAQIDPALIVGPMQADPSRNLVYVLDQTHKRVLAIDTNLARTASFADVGAAPTALAISPDDK